MAASVEALITPEVMRWAREQARLSLDEAARKIGRPAEEIAAWEVGARAPTVAQLREASRVYKRPLAVFYLPEPPADAAPLRDFRMLPDSQPQRYSAELALLIRTADSRRQWLGEFLESEGADSLPFVGSASLTSSPSGVATAIREALAITREEIRRCANQGEALRLWIRRTEAIGVFVFRERAVSLMEARGFVISDPYAPMIFINANDAQAAQIFTLAHELAHVWLGHSAISNLESHGRVVDRETDRIETFCNQVAAEVILEPAAFREAWAAAREPEFDSKLSRLAREFKVSEIVLARRLLQESIIARDTYQQVQARVQKRWQEESGQERKKGPVDYAKKMASQNGYLFTRTVIAGYLSGTVSGRDAADLLNVKIDNFRKLGNAVGLPA